MAHIFLSQLKTVLNNCKDPKGRRRNIRHAAVANGGKCVKNTPRIPRGNPSINITHFL